MILFDRLKNMGCAVWYDNGVMADQRNLAGMRMGVRESACVLIFLSGRKELRRKADPNGEYEGPFTRGFCHEEMATAHRHCVPFIGVMEPMDEHDRPDFALEKSRARTGGKDAAGNPAPVSAHVEQNLKLLDELCFTPFQRQEHLVSAMLAEIERLAIEARPRTLSCTCDECSRT